MRWLTYLSCSILLSACGQAATQPAAAPPPATVANTGTPAAPAGPSDPGLVPPPPAECQSLVEHGKEKSDCGTTLDATESLLAAALETSDAATRDAKLARLEACVDLAPGVVRGLRVELAPVACGDAIVGQLSAEEADELAPPIRDALRGLSIAAQLNRLVRNPPELQPPFDKDRFNEFMQGELAKWIVEQAHAIQKLAEEGASLEGYGKGVVAVEAGLADMRFVEVVRGIPLPDSIAGDQELTDVYYGSLDQALEPRKQRGRDAALVGLKLLAEVGVLNDQRLDRARSLLSKLYNGRRIDALDALMLPDPKPPAPSQTLERLAATLPTFYAGILLREADPGEPSFLRALLSQGLPNVHRSRLDAQSLAPEARLLVARALLRSGQLYWRAADFEQVGVFLKSPIGGADAETAKLLEAVADALKSGPADAAQMMASGPGSKEPVDVSKLDGLALRGGPLAGAAQFDAAYILQLAPPAERPKPFWSDLERRYRRAAQRLDGADKQRAIDAAAAAQATLKAIP